jgi:hypothetical protein
MLTRSNRHGVFAAASTLLLLATAAQAQTNLRWKLTPGSVLNHSLTQDSDTAVNVGGQMITTKMMRVVNTVWSVNDVSDQGTADITQSFSGIKFKLTSMAFNLDYDSASATEPTDPIGQQIATSLKPLTQIKFNFKLSPRGEITEVTVPDESRKLLAGVQLDPQMAGALSPEGMIAMIKECVIPFPAEPLQKGSSWKHKSESKVPPIGMMVNEATLTYDGKAPSGKPLEQFTVQIASKLTADPNNELAQFSMKEQSELGKLYFDNIAGRLSHSESTQVLVMDVTAVGQKFEQTVKTIKKAKLTLAE